MTEISRFYGIIICMYWNDHAPPHFHAKYNGEEVLLLIDTWEIYSGYIPKRALKLVIEWADLHRDEIIKDWEDVTNGKQLTKIEPLT